MLLKPDGSLVTGLQRGSAVAKPNCIHIDVCNVAFQRYGYVQTLLDGFVY